MKITAEQMDRMVEAVMELGYWDIYGNEENRRALIQEFLDNYNEENTTLKELKEFVYEWTEGQADIYNNDLYSSVAAYSDHINQVLVEDPDPKTLAVLISAGQFRAWYEFISIALSELDI